MKRVFIIHGWDGVPDDSWKPWLTKELEKHGFSVTAPQMPGKEFPKLKDWIAMIAKTVGTPDKNTFFVGHSLGCISIVRYLGTLPAAVKVGGCVFVAGFSGNIGIPQISEFYSLPVDVTKARVHTDKFVMIHSDNDEDVPFEKAMEFKNQLNAKLILEHNMGHISEDAGIRQLPSALNELLLMSK